MVLDSTSVIHHLGALRRFTKNSKEWTFLGLCAALVVCIDISINPLFIAPETVLFHIRIEGLFVIILQFVNGIYLRLPL